ncbi:ribosome-associated protein, partial [Neisseria gonorrhoeae]
MQGVRCKKPSERGGILLKYAIGKNSRIKMFEQEDEWISKTQMKKQMNGLQDLGMELTRLSN